ncbi:TatD DNase [Aphanomyces cochlioides]|nr:TatD DNase [Aphanomyces cochlioides]
MVRPLRLIDIGANLTDPMFVGLYRGKQKHANDFEHMLERAFGNHVNKIIVTGGSLSESKEALALARQHEKLHCTVGVHPTRCNEFDDDPDKYMQGLHDVIQDGKSDGKVVAVGEFGLDYDRLEFCDQKTQQTYFARQFELARTSRLPLFLHNRNTGSDFYDIVSRHRDDFRDGVVHSFTGSIEEAKQLLDLGLFIGINGCSLKSQESHDVVKSIPIDRLMLETDAPWCDIRPTHASYAHVKTHFDTKKPEKFAAGVGVKGRNEPCAMIQVLEVVSAIHGMDVADVADTVYETTARVFFP